MKRLNRRRLTKTLKLLGILMASVLLTSAVASADVVLDWNAIAVNTFVANKQNPFAQARYGAIVQLAVFEAVNAVRGDYRPYLGVFPPFSDLTSRNPYNSLHPSPRREVPYEVQVCLHRDAFVSVPRSHWSTRP